MQSEGEGAEPVWRYMEGTALGVGVPVRVRVRVPGHHRGAAERIQSRRKSWGTEGKAERMRRERTGCGEKRAKEHECGLCETGSERKSERQRDGGRESRRKD